MREHIYTIPVNEAFEKSGEDLEVVKALLTDDDIDVEIVFPSRFGCSLPVFHIFAWVIMRSNLGLPILDLTLCPFHSSTEEFGTGLCVGGCFNFDHAHSSFGGSGSGIQWVTDTVTAGV